MGDPIKIKAKRYKSSSSLGGVPAEPRKSLGNFYLRELDMEEKFTAAEEKCEKVKKKLSILKKIKKLRKPKSTIVKPQDKKDLGNETSTDIKNEPLEIPEVRVENYGDVSMGESLKKPRLSPSFQRRSYERSTLPIKGREKSPCNVNDGRLSPVLQRRSYGGSSLTPDTKPKSRLNATSDQLHVPKLKRRRSWGSTSALQDETNFTYRANIKNKSRSSLQLFNDDKPQPYEHHYETPTLSSQLKQTAPISYEIDTKAPFLPFISAASANPSHNIGINLNKLWSGLKSRQPLSGIPLTMAHHLGLSYIPTKKNKSDTGMDQAIDNQKINAIKLGGRSLTWSSFKKMSLHSLVKMYREEDGMVSRFLRSSSRRRRLDKSNDDTLPTDIEDFRRRSKAPKNPDDHNETRRLLEEYLALLNEYKHIEELIKQGNSDPELRCRRDELSEELITKVELVREVIEGCPIFGDLADTSTLYVSKPTTDDTNK